MKEDNIRHNEWENVDTFASQLSLFGGGSAGGNIFCVGVGGDILGRGGGKISLEIIWAMKIYQLFLFSSQGFDVGGSISGGGSLGGGGRMCPQRSCGWWIYCHCCTVLVRQLMSDAII